jgi:signal transduction histidine kinase
MEDIDTKALLTELADRLGLMLKENNATLRISCGSADIRANKSLVIQVFENLITNAVKYKSPDRAPVVEVGLESESDGYRHFYIRDNGIGIDLKDHGKIFHEFTARMT